MRKAALILLPLYILFMGCSTNVNTAQTNHSEIQERNFVSAHVVPEGHVWHQSLLKLEEEVQERTDGKWTFDFYPQGSLGPQNDMYQQLQVGSIDLAVLVGPELNSHSEAFAAWAMPFILRDHEDAFKMGATEEAHQLFDTLDGVVGQGYFFAGMRHVLSSDHPLTTIQDFNGLSLRISPSPAITDFWQQSGSGPTPVPAADLYSSFQTGVVDAIDIDLDLMMNNGYYDIGDYFTPLNHMSWAAPVLLNEQLYDSFSEKEKQIFSDSLDVAIQHNKKIAIEREVQQMKDFEEQGGTIVEIEDFSDFYNVAENIHDEYAEANDYIGNFINKAKEISEYDN
ncbi:TRAP transporter substrate-binding protein [Geomicrobium sp. JSM 1781026]|uniref:TRAP transporter substrate-binding protein n=1 Tax=Geomicrobium sp. JSM 1781026 TaxID=3344580 RepID=UPI0035BFCCB0